MDTKKLKVKAMLFAERFKIHADLNESGDGKIALVIPQTSKTCIYTKSGVPVNRGTYLSQVILFEEYEILLETKLGIAGLDDYIRRIELTDFLNKEILEHICNNEKNWLLEHVNKENKSIIVVRVPKDENN